MGVITMLSDLQSRYDDVTQKMNKVYDDAKKQTRELTGEEVETCERMIADRKSLQRQIEVAREIEQAPMARTKAIVEIGEPNRSTKVRDTAEYTAAVYEYLRTGRTRAIDTIVETSTTAGNYDASGTYVAPQSYETTVRELLTESSVFLPIADVFQTTSDRNIPVETAVGTATLEAENTTATADNNPTITRKTLKAYKLRSLIPFSEEMLYDLPNFESYLAGVTARQMAAAIDSYIVTGNGTTEPTGMDSGTEIPTAHKIVQTSGSNLANDIRSLRWKTDPQYHKGSCYVLGPTAAAAIDAERETSSTAGQFMWGNLAVGSPNLLNGYPYYVSTAVDTSTYGVYFGNFKYLAVALRGPMQVVRLAETSDRAKSGIVYIRTIQRFDSLILNGEAFAAIDVY